MEIVDVFNRQNTEKIGEEEREVVHEKSLWHRQISVWVMNLKDEVLLQRRCKLKKQKPNKLSICSGHIDANEEAISAALRELEEEIGLTETENNLEFIGIFENEEEGNNSFKYTYLVKTDKDINDFVMQEEEVSELKYVTLEELEKMIDNKDEELTFSKKYYINTILEELKKRKIN